MLMLKLKLWFPKVFVSEVAWTVGLCLKPNYICTTTRRKRKKHQYHTIIITKDSYLYLTLRDASDLRMSI